MPSLISGVAIGLGVVACSFAGRSATGRTAAVTLGVGAGLAFAASAALLKEVMTILHGGVAAALVSWPLYGLIVVGALGLFLSQLAFQAGPLRFSLPVITTVDPIVSLVIGVSAFDEPFRGGSFYLVGDALGLALICVAAAGLCRHENETVRSAHPDTAANLRHLVLKESGL